MVDTVKQTYPGMLDTSVPKPLDVLGCDTKCSSSELKRSSKSTILERKIRKVNGTGLIFESITRAGTGDRLISQATYGS